MKKPSVNALKLSKTSLFLMFGLSAVHILNYLNYSSLAALINVPMVRAGLLAGMFSWVFFTRFHALLNFHLRRNYDIYAFCVLTLISVLISEQPTQTLIYAVWLFLSIYLALDLSSRLGALKEIVFALAVVIIPVVVISAIANYFFGPEVMHTGRVFGALGTRHVDAALSLNIILLFLAVSSMHSSELRPSMVIGLGLAVILLYSVYIAVFALTRSVWLCSSLGILLYALSSGKSLRVGIVRVVLVAAALTLLASVLDIDVTVPESVEARVEQTLERYESGSIDARLVQFEEGYELIRERPFLGYGYNSGYKAHNSYLNLLIDTGLLGFSILAYALVRSGLLLARVGRKHTMFFLIGVGGLLVHAIFESQNTPGQANFIPILVWLALARSRYVLGLEAEKSRPGINAPGL